MIRYRLFIMLCMKKMSYLSINSPALPARVQPQPARRVDKTLLFAFVVFNTKILFILKNILG